MKKYIVAGLFILWSILFVQNQASAGNTQVWLLILWSWETLSWDTSSYFPPVTWSNNTGSNTTWNTNTGTNNGWGGWSTVTPWTPLTPTPTLTGTNTPPATTGTTLTWVIIPPTSWDQTTIPWTPAPSWLIDQEVISAYNWAKQYGITTIQTRDKARLDQPLLRAELAKMMVNFSLEVMWKTITPQWSCTIESFKDYNQLDSEEKIYVKQACDLQIMWWKNDKKSLIEYFNPHKPVSRAEFGTVLSRFLYGNTYNGDTWDDWFKAHLVALNHDNIMKKIDQPYLNEIRWYVMVMLQRVYK